jgi:hypothetical protein
MSQSTSISFRALCAELLQAIDDDVLDVADGPRFQAAIDRTRAELVKPEPQGEAGEVADWLHDHALDCRELGRNDWAAQSTRAATLLQQQQHLLGLACAELDAFMEQQAASLNRAEQRTAQPEPEGPTDEEIEEAAKLIHASMRFAVPDSYYTRDWVERGNSLMQDEARRTARAILARWGRPAIKPVPVAERPWEREGWCDVEGRCWLHGPHLLGAEPAWVYDCPAWAQR